MAPQDSSVSALQTHLKRLWIHGFLAGFVVVLVIVLAWYFIWGWPSTTPEGQEEPKPTISQAPANPETSPAPVPQAAPPPAAAAKPPETLKADLEAVLTRLAEANRKKDLPLLLSLYDPEFQDLPRKTEEISRTWTVYDYRNLRFRVDEIKSSSSGQAVARVIWEAETKNRATDEIKNLTKTYLVEFTNNSGQWRIKSLERAGKTGAQERSG
jgi:hypothetical protein